MRDTAPNREQERFLLCTDKFAPHRGGTAIIYTEWCQHLRDDVEVLTCRVPGSDWRTFDAEAPFRITRVPFANIPKLRYPLAWMWMHRRASSMVRDLAPAVVHAGQVLETGLSGAALSGRYGVPLIVHTYGEEIESYRHGSVTGAWLRRVLSSAHAITTISSYTRTRLLELGVPDERIHLQYPGVRADLFASADGADLRRRLGLGERPTMLTIARLLERKGHDTVLRALPRIARQVPNVAYLIVGSGPREAALRRLVGELRLGQHVVFVDGVAHSSTPSYYAAADVFIHPNRQLANGDVEGFGIVFLEANAAGKPVIGGNSGGTPDAVVDGVTGILVDPTDVESVADAAIRLLTDRGLARRLGEQGQERARTEFTWESAVDRLRALNRKVVEEYRRQRNA